MLYDAIINYTSIVPNSIPEFLLQSSKNQRIVYRTQNLVFQDFAFKLPAKNTAAFRTDNHFNEITKNNIKKVKHTKPLMNRTLKPKKTTETDLFKKINQNTCVVLKNSILLHHFKTTK